jgi:DNA topoisomerase-3
MDWLIGMNGTRAFALKTASKTVIGRVQTPVLKLIVDRELEIQNFKPVEYFVLNATFNNDSNSQYIGTYFNPNDDKMIIDKKEIENIKNDLKNEAKIIAVETKRVETQAPQLFSLTTLQQEANTKLGFSAQKTLDLAQSLYEKKITSYPRTESVCVTESVAKTFPNLLNNLKNVSEYTEFIKKITKTNLDKASENSKYVNDKKVGSHYALIPTTENPNKVSLTSDEKALYDLICRRFIAIFMPASVCDKTVIVTEDDGHLFKTNGSIMIDKGYLEVLGKNSVDTELPLVKKGDKVNLIDTDIQSKFTQPPTRYNDATLIKAMETAGKNIKDEQLLEEMKGLSLGTPATRAGIIERLLQIGVIKKDKKYFVPTDLGMWQIKTLGNMNIANVELTAEFEKKLSMIEDGTLKTDNFNKEMIQYITGLVNELKSLKYEKNVSTTYSNNNNSVLGKCPKCNSDFISTSGKFGKYFKCTSCDFKISGKIAGKAISDTNVKELLKNQKTKEIKGFISKNNKKFNAILILENNEIKFQFK